MNVLNVEYQKRLMTMHREAKKNSTLPGELNQLSGLLLLYALNWEGGWDGGARLGIKGLINLIDGEHYDDDPLAFGEYDFRMPIGDTTMGFDWRKASTRWDDAPMDVEWTFDQLGML